MSYPDTVQLRIVKMITAIIERINPDNIDPATGLAYASPGLIDPKTKAPYAWDFRGRVHRGKLIIGDGPTEKPPSIALLETPTPIQGLIIPDTANLNRVESLTLLIQGFSPDVSTHKADSAYAMRGQVEQLLARIAQVDSKSGLPVFPADYMLGKKANGRDNVLTDLTIGQGAVRPATENVSPTAFFYLPVVAKFNFNPAYPWAS